MITTNSRTIAIIQIITVVTGKINSSHTATQKVNMMLNTCYTERDDEVSKLYVIYTSSIQSKTCHYSLSVGLATVDPV